MQLIAGSVDVGVLMGVLAAERQVFHSEADFQHAFAWAAHRLESAFRVRLEVRQMNREYIDLIIYGRRGTTAIELKYPTASWNGIDPSTSEPFALRHHGAPDLARRNFIFDIARLERFCRATTARMNGLALILTNERSLWTPPSTDRWTRDEEFRIHEGRCLTGTLQWAQGAYPANQRDLIGTYPLRWVPYTRLPGSNGEFRWLCVEIAARSTSEPPAALG